MSSEYSDSSSDELGEELSIEKDLAINVALSKVTTGEAIKNEEISIDSVLAAESSKDKDKLLEDNRKTLGQISAADPNDETDAFLLKYFGERKWEEKARKPTKEEIEADDDIEEVDQEIEFEEHYNFHHQEKGFETIPTNPRFVEGEDRVKESSRHKKRREAAEKAKISEEEYQKKLDEIDEKYKAIAEKNNGRLTNEQLHQYTEEYSVILLEQQDGVFNYLESSNNGGMEKSIKILDAEYDGEEEEGSEEGSENDDGENKGEKRKKLNNRGRGGFRGKRGGGNFRGRGGFNRGGPRGGFGGRGGRGGHGGGSRMSSYFDHRK
ncbi:hypothetical protein TRFO_19532 [Tritrichomonas foetus]|uniref:Uncharacterized protein n=1 Tax=Tritrichomonas foetus TaxID=1144522 RepID=A0A1J4KJ47_9EUKA|nr:hypothetical protein TRFO_19532 [Tritrichomonas foetus]|eukprot:OHT10960.1 hypothetical protein TRFO_19532 [Tritrichomonas foetus]